MADVHTPEQRSYNMSQIRGKTQTRRTRAKISVLKRIPLSQKRQQTPGKPDIVLPKYKTVIFVNGCFWHGHEGCRYFVWPKNNAEFWKEKFPVTFNVTDKTINC